MAPKNSSWPRGAHLLGVELVCFLFALPLCALGQESPDVATVRNGADLNGLAAHEAGDFEDASSCFAAAYEERPNAIHAYWLARSQAAAGHLLRAKASFLLAIDHETSLEPIRSDAKRRLDELKDIVPEVLVRTIGPPPEDILITLDDEPISATLKYTHHSLDPGLHRIVAVYAGQKQVHTWESQRGGSKVVVIEFDVETAPQLPAALGPSLMLPRQALESPTMDFQSAASMENWGWTGLSLGVGGLLLGGLSATMLASRLENLDCPTHRCEAPADSASVHNFNQLRAISATGLILGSALSGVSVALIVKGQAVQRAWSADAALSRGGVALRGMF